MATIKLHNANLELLTLKALCRLKDPNERRQSLSALRLDHFNTKLGQLVYTICKDKVRDGGEVPTWDSVRLNAALTPDRQDVLKALRPVKATVKLFDDYKQSLDEWRRRRLAVKVATRVQEELQGADGSFDSLPLLAELKSYLDLSHDGQDRYEVFDIAGASGARLLDDILSADATNRFIPTGIEAFDSVNVGIPVDGVMVIAAKSGEGKSALSLQIAVNQARMGRRVVYCPLEMNGMEVGARLVASVCEFLLGKIIRPQDMTPKEVSHVKKGYTKLRKELKEVGGNLILMKPRFSPVTIEDVLNDSLLYDPDMVWVDYLTLLDDSPKSRKNGTQAESIGASSQYSKSWASKHKKAVGLIAQLNDYGEIKYARKILEDANVSWIIMRDRSRPNVIVINQKKCRHGKEFDFCIDSDYETMRFTSSDLTPEMISAETANDNKTAPSNKTGWSKRQGGDEKPPAKLRSKMGAF